jgi:hypothetical protein
MSVARWLRHELRLGFARAAAAFPFGNAAAPVFILGCGRSGTTILGTALSKHSQIVYLNEPRHLWFAAYPETDVWTTRAAARGGRLVLTAADANEQKSARLRRLFWLQSLVTRKPLVVEKLPINAFRLELLRAVFPEARFIHIYRNGLEVARSINRDVERRHWFGANRYKWQQLVDHSKSRVTTQNLPELCENDVHRGLLEWRLGSEAIVEFLRQLPSYKFCEISYTTLINTKSQAFDDILAFLALEPEFAVSEFVARNVDRRTAPLHLDDATPVERAIGGTLLIDSFRAESLIRRAA